MPRSSRRVAQRWRERRQKILRSAFVAVPLIVFIWWWLRGPVFVLTPRADRNILLVTIDALRADVIGAYGGRATTPTIDALAGRGAAFSFAHAHAVVTLPATASILTGRYPFEHGLRDDRGARLPATEQTIATRLKALGYATGGFVGAWPLEQRSGLNLGFDTYDDRLTDDGADREFVWPERRADAVVAAADEWISKQTGRWFAWVHLTDPHAPYRPPPDWLKRFPKDPYLAEVSWTDSSLARLIARARRQPRPTLIVVTADHGESLGDHGEPTHGLLAYEAALRVPLVVAELGRGWRRPRGQMIDRPVRHVDVLPTVLAALGVTVESDLPGASLLALIGGSTVPDRASYFEAMTAHLTRGWPPLRGAVANREKYIELPVPELYDLVDDPRETHNFLSIATDRLSVVQRALEQFNATLPAQSADDSKAGVDPAAAPAERDDPKQLVRIEQSLDRARQVYDEKRFDEAIEIYKQILESRPETEDAARHLAFVYWKTGQRDQAIQTLEHALKVRPASTGLRVRLGGYLAEVDRVERAVSLLEAASRDDPDALTALGVAYVKAGRTSDAIEQWKHAVALSRTAHEALYHLGMELAAAGRMDEARTYGQQFIDTAPASRADDVARMRKMLNGSLPPR